MKSKLYFGLTPKLEVEHHGQQEGFFERKGFPCHPGDSSVNDMLTPPNDELEVIEMLIGEADELSERLGNDLEHLNPDELQCPPVMAFVDPRICFMNRVRRHLASIKTRFAADKLTGAWSTAAGVALRNIAKISFIPTADQFVTVSRPKLPRKQSPHRPPSRKASAQPPPPKKWLPNAETVMKYQNDLARVRKELVKVKDAVLGKPRRTVSSKKKPGKMGAGVNTQTATAISIVKQEMTKHVKEYPDVLDRYNFVLQYFVFPQVVAKYCSLSPQTKAYMEKKVSVPSSVWAASAASQTLRLRREQKALSPVIGERAFAVGTYFSRRQWWWVPGC